MNATTLMMKQFCLAAFLKSGVSWEEISFTVLFLLLFFHYLNILKKSSRNSPVMQQVEVGKR